MIRCSRAVAASGSAFTGYEARHNLVLRGGGVHDRLFNHYTHQFDAHGDENCDDLWISDSTYDCGNAGENFWITANTFQYTNDDAIKFRGTPRGMAYIRQNIFAHANVGDAVRLKSHENVDVSAGPAAVASRSMCRAVADREVLGGLEWHAQHAGPFNYPIALFSE